MSNTINNEELSELTYKLFKRVLVSDFGFSNDEAESEIELMHSHMIQKVGSHDIRKYSCLDYVKIPRSGLNKELSRNDRVKVFLSFAKTIDLAVSNIYKW